jgi:glucose dehydrogenase
MRMKWWALGFVSVAAFVALTNARLRSAQVIGEWRAYNGSYASTRYSPLDQINKDTVKNLKVVWRQSLTPDAVKEGREGVPPAPANNQTTPLMIGGLVYRHRWRRGS